MEASCDVEFDLFFCFEEIGSADLKSGIWRIKNMELWVLVWKFVVEILMVSGFVMYVCILYYYDFLCCIFQSMVLSLLFVFWRYFRLSLDWWKMVEWREMKYNGGRWWNIMVLCYVVWMGKMRMKYNGN